MECKDLSYFETNDSELTFDDRMYYDAIEDHFSDHLGGVLVSVEMDSDMDISMLNGDFIPSIITSIDIIDSTLVVQLSGNRGVVFGDLIIPISPSSRFFDIPSASPFIADFKIRIGFADGISIVQTDRTVYDQITFRKE